MKFYLLFGDCKLLNLFKKMSKCKKELFFTSMLQWHFKLPLGVFRNKYKGFMYKCEKDYE